MMVANTLIDGIPESSVPVMDRGLMYGDGVFETMRVLQGEVPLFTGHWRRLTDSCSRLGLFLPFSDRQLQSFISQVSEGDDALVKLILTRGSGGRGYLPPNDTARWILQAMPLPETPDILYHKGACVRLCRVRLSDQPLLAGIKHLNRLEQVMARAEWQNPFFYEGLMCDQHGVLVEAVMSNLFWIRNEVLLTPDLSRSGVSGVLRHAVIELAQQLGIPLHEVRSVPEDLRDADAVFLSNGIRGLIPVSGWFSDDQQPIILWSSAQHSIIARLMCGLHPALNLPVFDNAAPS